jgi:hypothetical protein
MVTRWSPDTCQCVIEYNADLSLNRIVNACVAHQGGTESTVYSTVLEENPRKNRSLKEIIDNAPASMFDIDADSGTRVFKKGISIDFQWQGVAPDRTLTLTVKGITLTANQINAVQNKLDTRFGAGKVTVVQG